MRSSWADSIAGDAYLLAFNWPAGDINSYNKKLGSGVSYGKSVHAEFISSATIKQANSHNNYGDKLSACTRSSLGPKKKCVAEKESQYVDNHKFMVHVKKSEDIITYFMLPRSPRRNVLVLLILFLVFRKTKRCLLQKKT